MTSTLQKRRYIGPVTVGDYREGGLLGKADRQPLGDNAWLTDLLLVVGIDCSAETTERPGLGMYRGILAGSMTSTQLMEKLDLIPKYRALQFVCYEHVVHPSQK